MVDRRDDALLTASDATRELSRLGVDLSVGSVKRFADLGQIPSVRTRDRGVRGREPGEVPGAVRQIAGKRRG